MIPDNYPQDQVDVSNNAGSTYNSSISLQAVFWS